MADDRAGLDPELQRLADRFSGCLLGAMLGDVLGAPVEAEPGGWIEKNFSRPEELLTYDTAAGPLVPAWEAGRYTDDTQTGMVQTMATTTGEGAVICGAAAVRTRPRPALAV